MSARTSRRAASPSEDLLLERARRRRDHDLLPAKDGWNQVRERLSGAGPRLDEERAFVFEGRLDRLCHDDAATKSVIDKGARNVEILKQPQFSPYSVEKQVAIIYLGTNGLLRDVPVKNVRAFEEQFLRELELKHPDLLEDFKKGNLPEEGLAKMTRLAENVAATFKN